MASKYIILTLAIATLALLIHSSVLVTGQDLLFNETFNAATEPHIYVRFIENLRTRVQDKNLTFVGGVPMLPSVQECDNKHFHIILRHGDSMITLQIQQVNLYLVAFQGTNGPWYAFEDEGNKAPPNSRLLSFPASYPLDGSVARTKVGRLSLEDAIFQLAKYHKKENQPIRSLLIKLMVMFPEAIRFKKVAEYVNKCMLIFCKEEPEIDPQKYSTNITQLIHKWDDISKEMRRYDQFGNFRGFDGLKMTTVEEVVSTVGILLYQEIPKGPDKKMLKACKRSGDDWWTNTCPAKKN